MSDFDEAMSHLRVLIVGYAERTRFSAPTLARQLGAILEQPNAAWTPGERAVAAFVESATAEAIADRIERELVCCDAFDGSGNYEEHHAICYWGGAAAKLAREYASGELDS